KRGPARRQDAPATRNRKRAQAIRTPRDSVRKDRQLLLTGERSRLELVEVHAARDLLARVVGAIPGHHVLDPGWQDAVGHGSHQTTAHVVDLDLDPFGALDAEGDARLSAAARVLRAQIHEAHERPGAGIVADADRRARRTAGETRVR